MKLKLVALALVVSQARAIAGPSAEELYSQGQAAYDAANYVTAIVKWTQSYELSSAPELLFDVAQAYRLHGDCAHALDTYKRFIQIDPTSAQRVLAADFVRELQPKCGASGTPPPAVERPSTKPGRGQRISGLAIGGGGIAIAVTGLLFGHRASSLGDEVSRACAQECDWAAQRDRDTRGRRYASIGYALDGLGVAAIAGGAVMYFLRVRRTAVTVAPTSHESGAIVTWSSSW